MTDLETTLAALHRAAPDRVTTGALLGAGTADGATIRPTPIGDVVIAFNVVGVVSVDLADDDRLEARHRARFGRPLVTAELPRAWGTRLDRALEMGAPGDLPLDFRALTPFQRSVLGAAATIPRGEVRPYGWLAREVENPGAVRAVGSVMAANPVPLVVPCHRVVRSDGRIGAYSLGGDDNKRALLTHEGIDPADLEALARRGVRYVGSATTGVFCLPTCRHARRIDGRHRTEFSSRDDAAADGFRPCAVCRP